MNSYTWRVHLGQITMLVQAEDVIEAVKATGWHGKTMRGGVVSVTREAVDETTYDLPPMTRDENKRIAPWQYPEDERPYCDDATTKCTHSCIGRSCWRREHPDHE